MSWPRAALAMLVAGLPAAASAQTDQTRLYDAYIASKPYMDWVSDRLNEMESPVLLAQCPKIKVTGRENSFVNQDARFAPGAAAPQSGQWVDRLSIDRCGKSATRNIQVTARGNDKLYGAAMIPGRTATSPLLQHDAYQVAAAKARIHAGCHDELYVVDSAVAGRFIPGAPWKEDWTFLGCDKATVMALTFTPNGRGGSTVEAQVK